MRHAALNKKGVSEVVGAMMLTLVVVIAVASFAIYLSQRQEQIQEQALFEHRKELESVEVFSVEPTVNTSYGDRWSQLNFSINSLHAEETNLKSILVNGVQIERYWVFRFDRALDAYVTEFYNIGDDFEIKAREQLNIVINMTYSFFYTGNTILTRDPIVLELRTNWNNEFTGSFLPPTANPKILTESHWNSASNTYLSYYILDGADSDHPGGGYLLSWEWNVSYYSNQTPVLNSPFNGRKVTMENGTFLSGIGYNITLTVTDNFGMFDSRGIVNFKP